MASLASLSPPAPSSALKKEIASAIPKVVEDAAGRGRGLVASRARRSGSATSRAGRVQSSDWCRPSPAASPTDSISRSTSLERVVVGELAGRVLEVPGVRRDDNEALDLVRLSR